MTAAHRSQSQGDEGHPSLGDLFPFDEPYEAQQDSTTRLAELLRQRGVAVLEGACGSGKTLSALTPALQAVRDPQTQFERVLVITSVKQQLRAFEQDAQSINDNLPEGVPPISALSLVGKEDVCPYANQGHISTDDFYSRCNSLCDPVRRAGASAPGIQEKIGLWDRMAGEAMDGSGVLEGDDWMAPYGESIPTDDENDEYCPFYASFRSEMQKEDTGFSPHGIMTPSDMLAHGADAGQCPHALMRTGLENAELLIGNYYHVFDPVTVERLTTGLIGPETILIIDEAHGLEESVRGLLSDDISRFALDRATGEVEKVLNSDGDLAKHARQYLSDEGVSEQEARSFSQFLKSVIQWIDNRAIDNLEDHDSGWLDDLDDLPEDFEDNLREPDEPQPDEFSEWVEDEGLENQWEDVAKIGQGIATALVEAAKEVGGSRDQTYADSVGRILDRWRTCGHEQYFRQFILEKRDRMYEREDGWKQAYRAKIRMHNCIPSDPIAERLDQFGASVLMSATLAPMDVYREVVGIDKLAEGSEDSVGRPVEEMVYGLDFPEENRRSLALKTTPFTGDNRDNPDYDQFWDDETEAVRNEYRNVILDVAKTTPGNVLICMPSYREGEWAAKLLKRDSGVEKDVHTDKSSSEEETEKLKEQFFAGEAKVLCTGLRGTLTEGVDYDGDRLAAVLVCGVPIRGLGGDYPDAIQTAYENRFGENNGFEYAFTVPAVRKARQAIGRVIRGDDEVGVRVLADARYAEEWRWNNVREYLPEYALEDFQTAGIDLLNAGLERFWEGAN
ncbi:Helicase protein [Halorhabdus tiamatea SARL4B]|uniref:Helicase protein n=1 Tax=Halorhabdus tiamatea SARL4B TaxID=1033806 RepID=U2E5D0_9EURY|nr:ATP-dependent DNA helicase [Halorhabdus tiamatea]ERJ07418.1 Helicase protein [Halorhabdus tiamatea SARL4B]